MLEATAWRQTRVYPAHTQNGTGFAAEPSGFPHITTAASSLPGPAEVMTPDPQKQNHPCTEKETKACRGGVHCRGHTDSKTRIFSTVPLCHAVPSFGISAAPSAYTRPVLGHRKSSEQNRPKSPPWGAPILEQHCPIAPGVIYNFLYPHFFFLRTKR